MPALDLPSRPHLADLPGTLQRDELRAQTAYPFLRKMGHILIYLSAACAGCLWLTFFYVALNTTQIPSIIFWLMIAVAGSLIVPVTIFLNGVAQALVDIADLQLRQL